MWFAKHPLRVGACVLMLYISMSVVVGFVVSFVAGVFLFLTGVRGIIVAFLYVVALCPNPVFKANDNIGLRSGFFLFSVLGGGSVVITLVGTVMGYNVEVLTRGESLQWLRDPCMVGGLAELIPLLGVLLFLCMVSVVRLCGQQKQCLGGHGLIYGRGSLGGHTKRSYV